MGRANRRRKKINTAVAVAMVVAVERDEKWPARFPAFPARRSGFWAGKEGRREGSCKAIPPLRLTQSVVIRSESGQPRREGRYLHTTPTPTHFSGKKKWGRSKEIKKEGEANHIKLRFGSHNDHTTHLKGALAVCLLSRIMNL